MKLRLGLGLLAVLMVLVAVSVRTRLSTGAVFAGTPTICPTPAVGGVDLCGAAQTTANLNNLLTQPPADTGLSSGTATALTQLLLQLESKLANGGGPGTCALVGAIGRELHPAQGAVDAAQLLADFSLLRVETGCP